ncbi:hypothetical protein B5K11_15960 [Rhizobium leguminosarum bv. trifolii]|nr:hypothetical protein B5K11_15960 [Rhizobium leguminosarum bv. trifolii]
MTAGGNNPGAFEDLINGYALRENDGLDRSAKRLQTLDKTRQPARVSAAGLRAFAKSAVLEISVRRAPVRPSFRAPC